MFTPRPLEGQCHHNARRMLLTRGLICGLMPWAPVLAWAQPQPGSARLDEMAGADASGRRDSSEALRQALASGKPVYVPEGEFVVGGVALPAGANVYGPGTLRQAPQALRLFEVDSGSADVAKNVRGITLRGLTLLGRAETDGFFEHAHLFAASGVSNLMLEDVRFVGFRGDGLYLGSGFAPHLERHNVDVVIRRCVFDGVNRQNRNGISAVDCDGMLIEDCQFQNCTAPNMPGPIDLEPNANAWHVIQRIRIKRNRFTANGGNSGQISLYVPKSVQTLPQDILIEENELADYRGTGGDVTIQFQRRLNSADRDTLLRVTNNHGRNGYRPLRIYSGRQLIIQGNVWEGYAANAQLGHIAPTDHVEAAMVRHNQFIRCGTTEAGRYGLTLFSGRDVTIESNQFVDCGDSTAGSYALQFNRGSTRGLKVIGNEFSAPNGKTKVAMLRESAHTFEDNSVEFSRNVVVGAIKRGNVPGR